MINQVRFFDRWSDTLEHQPARPPLLDFAALHALAVRPAESQEVV